jgi:hypothetical protein
MTPLRSSGLPLDCELPEVFVERQQHPAICFGEIQEGRVSSAGGVGSYPEHVVARQSQGLHGWQREVFIRQQPDQTGSGYALYSEARWLAYARQARTSSCAKPG